MRRKLVVYLAWPEESFRATAEDVAQLQKRLPNYDVVRVTGEASFRSELKDASVAVCWNFDKAWFAEAPRLEILATPGAGRELLPSDAELPAGVSRINGTFHGQIMSETVIAFMFAYARGLYDADAFQRKGTLWPRTEMSRLVTHRVAGSYAVILGYGHIGRTLGAKLEALGVKVTGIRRSNLADLTMHLATADWLIACVPSDTGTDNLVNAHVLSAFKAGGVFINVGRGNCVDELALVAALESKHLAAAFLDVVKDEPMKPDSPFAKRIPNLHVMPHASAFSSDYLQLFWDELVPRLTETFNHA